MRFSLKWLLAGIAFVGIGSVAFFNANEVWAMGTMTFTVIVLLVAILGAVYSHSRAFYVGMCVFGWGYLLLTYGPIRDATIRPLATTEALVDLIDIAIHPAVDRSITSDPVWTPTTTPDGIVYLPARNVPATKKHFQTLGHALFALVFAIIGGLIAHWFSRDFSKTARK